MRTDIWGWWPEGRTIQLSPGDGAYLQACVHPDGERAVLWGGPPEARPRVWSTPTDRSAPVALTPPDVGARHGTFVLGGDRIAFSSDSAHGGSGTMADETPAGNTTSGHWNLFTMAPDGTDVRQVTDGAWVDQRPALSPDGATIAFVSDRAWGIWLVPADGSGSPTLLTEGQFLDRPAWSLDGSCPVRVPHLAGAPPGGDRRPRHRRVHTVRQRRPGQHPRSLGRSERRPPDRAQRP